MATSEGRTSGQKYKFISEPDDDLKCLICLEVAMDPMQHEECGKLFCKDCLESHGRTNPCPNCRTKDSQYYKDNRSKNRCTSVHGQGSHWMLGQGITLDAWAGDHTGCMGRGSHWMLAI